MNAGGRATGWARPACAMPKPPAPDRPELQPAGPTAFRIAWEIPDADPDVTACTVKVRIKGSQRWQNYDHSQGRIVPKGGSTVPAPISEVTADGCLEGIAYEAVVAAMNSEGWGEVSSPSEPGCIGTEKPRAKADRPAPPTLTPVAPGKLKCSWVVPEACPPVEACQVQLTNVSTGLTMLVDAVTGRLVSSGRTTFAVPKSETTVIVEEGIEFSAAVCCRNAEGFGTYSMSSDGCVSVDPKAASTGMELVLAAAPSAEVPALEPLGEGRMKVAWTLPEEAKLTMVKLRRVGDNNWRLIGGSAIEAPTCETVANGLEEGFQYEAKVAYLVAGRWSSDSAVSRPACIGELKMPGIPGAAKEPLLYVVDDEKLRIKWRTPTEVPPVTAITVMIRAVGSREWYFVQPSTGQPLPEDSEAVIPPRSEVDVVGLHYGVRYEAAIRLRNKLGLGPPSTSSEAACIGRPIPRLARCQYCYNDFDLQHAEYTRSFENFWCPPCRFRNMDPFNAVVEPNGLLKCQLVTRPTMTFSLDLPDLKIWRKEEHAVQIRMCRINSDNCAQVWPETFHMEANGNEVFKIDAPEEGHVRRDVPRSVSAGLKPGVNSVTIKIEDDYVAGFAMAIVHTCPQTVPQLAANIAVCAEEQARERFLSLLAESFQLAQPTEDEEDDEISFVMSCKLKLRCPLSFERVSIPVRGETCMHLQCFGLGAYLESNVKMRAMNNRWTCPVCGNVLRPRDLRRDAYVERICNETPVEVEEVVIKPEGSYEIVEETPGKGNLLKDKGRQDSTAEASKGNDASAQRNDDEKLKRKEPPAAEGEEGSKRQRRRQRLMSIEEDGNAGDAAGDVAGDAPADAM